MRKGVGPGFLPCRGLRTSDATATGFQPISVGCLGHSACREGERTQRGVDFAGFEMPAVDLQERAGNDEARPLVSVDEREVLHDAEGVAGRELEQAGLAVGEHRDVPVDHQFIAATHPFRRGSVLWGRIPRTCIPCTPSPQRGARRQPSGGAERNPGSPHPMTPRPNGANGDQTNPVPCALSGHKVRCVAWSPGFHPGLSPVAPSGHEQGSRNCHLAFGPPPSNLNLQSSNSRPPPPGRP